MLNNLSFGGGTDRPCRDSEHSILGNKMIRLLTYMLLGLASSALADQWRMFQRDMQHTGRSDFIVPTNRLNTDFFNHTHWQSPLPGPVGGNSPVFMDNINGFDMVVVGYHWPKGLKVMYRRTGRYHWQGLPDGGERIGDYTPALSANGLSLYVTNDATQSGTWPLGRPLMAVATLSGSNITAHNGAMVDPDATSMCSPTVADDGRIFLHKWGEGPAAALDNGSSTLSLAWQAATTIDNCFSDPVLFRVGGQLRAAATGRSGWMACWDGTSGAELWRVQTDYAADATPSADPANGHIYSGLGIGHIGVVGLDANGNPLWSNVATRLFTYEPGVNEQQRAQSAGCLSHDGATFYFQTVAQDGSGALYAVNTGDGSLKWQVATGSRGWEAVMASPIVTANGVVIVGNNEGGRWVAIRDIDSLGVVLDWAQTAGTGTTRATPSLSSDGYLYMPEYDVWSVGNYTNPTPDNQLHHMLTVRDLSAGDCDLANPGAPTVTMETDQIQLNWSMVDDPDGCFDHYAIYRSTTAFIDAGALPPIGTESNRLLSHYLDNPGTGQWYYAVAVVNQNGDLDPVVTCAGPVAIGPPADRWAMQQRDMEHTGRASFSIPAGRQNDQLFETCRWQTPLPGGVGGSSPLFSQNEGESVGRVAVGYHWPKGVQVMNRETGIVDWALNPLGGESIGELTGAISTDNATLYVVNDATESGDWPNGRPAMALNMTDGGLRAHSGANADPSLVSRPQLTVGDDERVYAHGWGLGPAALADMGGSLDMTWTPWSISGHYYNGVALHWWQGALHAVTGNESGSVECWSTQAGGLLWSVNAGVPVVATTTIDPTTGRSYSPAGSSSVGVVGLEADGTLLWDAAYHEFFTWEDGINAEQRAQAGGCLSHDGATFYFQTNAGDGSGVLYALSTADGSLKWSLPTGSAGWERISSCPMVTPNGILILGNNWDRWLAIRDDGAGATVLDEWMSDINTATSSPALSDEGLLYLSTRTDWNFPNGLQMPDHEFHDLVAAVDLSVNPWTVSPACALRNPESLQAVALESSVRLDWRPVDLPAPCFDHYRIYREANPFTDVSALTHVAEVPGVESTSYLDEGLANDQPYWHAVVGVDPEGNFDPVVTPTGPRTPHWLNDLQIACIRRGPHYPRYAPNYTGYEITEPGGFGPYYFSAATSLAMNQDCEDQRGPQTGEPVTWTATVRNAGTITWEGDLPWVWWVDNTLQTEGQRFVSLAPGDTAMFGYSRAWDENAHDLRFSIYSWDDRSENDDLEQEAWSVAFKTYVDKSRLEDFRENTPGYPAPLTDNLIDWLQIQADRFNQLFAEAGVAKRVHYDLLQVLDDAAPDPLEPPDIDYAIFPFRYRAGEGDPRLSGYYWPDHDIDYGLLHEMGHQLGLVDIYQMDVPPQANLVSGLSYTAHEDLMHGCSPVIGPHSAGAMAHWDRAGHGYYGQYLYGLPATMRMRFLDHLGNPLANAQVEVFQYCERPGLGKVISDQVKFSGVTDGDGVFTLPNVDIDESLAPATCLGDHLADNPFGYVAVIATNGVLHFRVSVDESIDYAWLDISEANVAYYGGATEEATFERQLMLGGEPDYFLEADLCETNAGSWAVSSNGSNSLADDAGTFHDGANALRAETAGDYLTLIHPGNRMGRYDLTGCDSLVCWTRVDNDWPFQMNAPQIRLYCPGGSHVQYLPDQDLLSQANGQWLRLALPLAGGGGWTRSEWGAPDLSLVNSIEFYADTWDWGFTWWLDGLHFTPVCCATDCNGNGIRDCDDIASGFSQDANGNQTPDECECAGDPIPAPHADATLLGQQLSLSWNAVTESLHGCPITPRYHIWSVDMQTGQATDIVNTLELQVLIPIVGTGGFYRVTVVDENLRGKGATPAASARGEAGPSFLDRTGHAPLLGFPR